MTAGSFLIACNNEKTESAGDSGTAAKSKVTLPMYVDYSSSFEIGDHKNSVTIMNGSWKDWENNNIDNMKSWVADTITAIHSDRVVINGVDNLITHWKTARAKYTSVIDTIDAIIPVFSTDKKENWVLVWARSINTLADGTKDSSDLMETWRINKDGKADFLIQYDRATRKQ